MHLDFDDICHRSTFRMYVIIMCQLVVYTKTKTKFIYFVYKITRYTQKTSTFNLHTSHWVGLSQIYSSHVNTSS